MSKSTPIRSPALAVLVLLSSWAGGWVPSSLGQSPDAAAESRPVLASGSGSFVFSESAGTAEKPITVWYWIPEHLDPAGRVLFVMHGVLRNGEEYRDAWVDLAREKGFILVVPEFSEEHYPGGSHYNLGNLRTSNAEDDDEEEEGPALNPEDLWSFSAIDPLFEHLRGLLDLETETYTIYGHSAGGQFVHRFVLMKPDARFDRAIAANAGWYTMPDLQKDFPFGLAWTGEEGRDAFEGRLRLALGRRLIVLLGEEDTDEQDRYLSRSAGAMEQGPHRFERGQRFFAGARDAAEALETPFGWELRTVPGVGHSNPRMAPAAVEALGW